MYGNPKTILIDDHEVADKCDHTNLEKLGVGIFKMKGSDGNDLRNFLMSTLSGKCEDNVKPKLASAANSTSPISPSLPRKVTSCKGVTLCGHSTTYAHNQTHIPTITVNTYQQTRHTPIRPLYPPVQPVIAYQTPIDVVQC